ncbi:MAG: KamA family radical SAM protein [Myxococcota bacterium]
MVRRDEIVAARPELDGVWDRADAAFPIRVTRSFWDRIDPTDPADPLALQVLPDPRELDPDPEDHLDPVGDGLRSPVPWVVHKYPDRLLLLLTKRCHLYCRYCFRRDHVPGEAADPSPEEWERALAYVRAARPREVILSGGDPLAVPIPSLLATIDAVREVARVVRIHTRAPITFPESVRPELVAGLRARAPVWVVVHCNHPRELSPEVDRALAALIDGGIPVLNQAVLLRGVNDDPEVLERLVAALVERRVHPYYLHVTDRARGNAHLRVDVPRARELYRALRSRIGGPAVPRLVIDPPDGSGKVDAESWSG